MSWAKMRRHANLVAFVRTSAGKNPEFFDLREGDERGRGRL